MTTISLLLCIAILPIQNPAPAAQDHPYEVVLVNDKILKIKEPPLFDGRQAHLVLLNGQKSTFPTKMIDQQKTLERNRRLAIQRQAALFQAEQQAKAAEEKAAATAQAEPEEKEERGPIVLTSTKDLPSTSGRDSVALPTAESEVQNAGEVSERRFSSNEDAFVARERTTKIPSGYKIDAEVNVNQPLGVNNVQVKMVIVFENEERFEAIESLGNMNYGQSKLARFTVRNNQPISTVSYQVRFITSRVR